MSARYPVLVAVTGAHEAALVTAIESQRDLAVVSRCADLADLMSMAATGRAAAVLVSPDLRHLDRDTVSRLRAESVAVVGVLAAGEQPGPRLRAIGITAWVGADADGASVLEAVSAAVDTPDPTPAWGNADPAAELDQDWITTDSTRSAGSGPGRLVAVWGPHGAPGRTTVAVNLAAELAAAGHSTLLADADSYASSVAQSLGILDEAPGIAAACRSAATGCLDRVVLAGICPLIAANLRVLTGISRSDRWPELSAACLEQVWAVARALCAWTVVDVAACLEQDEELSYDTAAPRRNAATLTTLDRADVVVAVGSADPVGLQRLIRGVDEIGAVIGAAPVVVVTKVRAGAAGPKPGDRVRQVLSRYAGVEQVVLLPDERDTLDAAMLAGRSLVEHAPGSTLRRAFTPILSAVTADTPQAACA